MRLKYINKIQANISIFSNKLSTNILEGNYKSVYKGKSMNFENLRNYDINDDIKDIDWKSSARSGQILVKQFFAEKKHNIMMIADSGIKFDADTSKHIPKKEIALYTIGTIGYIAIKNGDYMGLSFISNDKIIYHPLKYNLYNLEEYLASYDANATKTNTKGLNNLLEYVYKNIPKRMILFVITDMKGLDSLDKSLLKKVTLLHDILFVNVDDNTLSGADTFDVEENKYIEKVFLNDSHLIDLERQIKSDLLNRNEAKLKSCGISMVNIGSVEEINMKLIELLEAHKYASTH